MMKKMVLPVILMILTGLVLAAFFSCDTGGNSGPANITYTGKDTDGTEYELIITGKTYELQIDGDPVSTGKIAKMGDTLILTPNGDGDDFEITVDGDYITKIEGDITPDDDSEPIKPGEMVPPFEAVAGKWNWYTSDDSKTNEDLDVQTIFPPGGVSRITNAKDVTGPDGKPGKGPYEYPEATKPKDISGNPITVPVYNFTGNTKVDPKKPANISKFGAGWPLVGWEAQPADEETKALLKTAYGYSFWVKLNSSKTNTTKDNEWAYLTQVETDFPREKGYEYKHWFGNKPGDSGGGGAKNLTGDLEAGTWNKITVIMDPSGFNMAEDNWLFQWSPTPDPKKPFKQSEAKKIQWQIPLQHNGGAQRTSDPSDGPNPYDQISGTHDFNLDFYGLELLIKQ